MLTVLSIIVAIASIVVIGSVLVQESEQAGLGTVDGSVAEANWGAHVGTSRKQMLQRTTVISSAVLAVSVVALLAIS